MPPFRADHVGSLLRPQKLKEARAAWKAGKLPAASLRAMEDEEIRRIVKRQEDAGLEVATDGEFRRDYWYLDFFWRLKGVVEVNTGYMLKFRTATDKVEANVPSFKVVDRIGSKETVFGEDFSFLRTISKVQPKITIPSPSMMHFRGRSMGIDPAVYADFEEYRADLARVYREQIAGLARLGCTYLQLDDTSWGFASDAAWRQTQEEWKQKGFKVLEAHAQVLNGALARRPAGMTIAMHVCRGNFKSAWAAEGGYDEVADVLFNQVNVDAYFLEYDDARSGSFEPLKRVPKGKRVVLGLVSSKLPGLEKKDDLKRRIEEASKYLPLEQLALSPQCGFASTIEGNALSEDEQMAKLRLVVEVAREVWT